MNQVEVKRRQIQSFSYVLACINIWVFGKSIGDNGLGYLAAFNDVLRGWRKRT